MSRAAWPAQMPMLSAGVLAAGLAALSSAAVALPAAQQDPHYRLNGCEYLMKPGSPAAGRLMPTAQANACPTMGGDDEHSGTDALKGLPERNPTRRLALPVGDWRAGLRGEAPLRLPVRWLSDFSAVSTPGRESRIRVGVSRAGLDRLLTMVARREFDGRPERRGTRVDHGQREGLHWLTFETPRSYKIVTLRPQSAQVEIVVYEDRPAPEPKP